jgi:predicted nucleic acid-binding protein
MTSVTLTSPPIATARLVVDTDCQIGAADAWIAATALALSVPLVTNNPKDYRNLDKLQLVSTAA